MSTNTFEISDDMKCFLQHIIHDEDELVTVNNPISNNSYKLCSHATTCKFKRDKAFFDKCSHTHTCEFFCQRFVDKEHRRIKDVQFDIDLEEARAAKKEKRHRIHFELDE